MPCDRFPERAPDAFLRCGSPMKLWVPSLSAGSGAEIFDQRLARALDRIGVVCELTPLPRSWQLFPWSLRSLSMPVGTSAIIANNHIAFALTGRGIPVVGVEHHCVLDRSYRPYCTALQSVYHRILVRRFESASLHRANAVVAVSRYTAQSLQAVFGLTTAQVIPNGVETDFFCPDAQPKPELNGRRVRLLFVGNLTRRKGADLLPAIMEALGPRYELRFTAGLRAEEFKWDGSNLIPLGFLTPEQLRTEYRRADLLLFPTRFEGFGYVAAEAMSCGTPVVATRCSSLPEIVDDGQTGVLCRMNDVRGFAEAIRSLTYDIDRLRCMGLVARSTAVKRFGLERMARAYAQLVDEVGRDSAGCRTA